MLRFLRSLHLTIDGVLACIQGTPVPLTSVEAEPPLPSIQPAQPASSAAQEQPSADVLIELKNVYKSFGSKAILRGANITIRRGEAVGIIGGSGTGKSTTLRIMAGLLMPDAVRSLTRRLSARCVHTVVLSSTVQVDVSTATMCRCFLSMQFQLYVWLHIGYTSPSLQSHGKPSVPVIHAYTWKQHRCALLS